MWVFQYIIKRLMIAIPLLIVISLIVFFLIHLAPYDVVDSITTPNMSQETIGLLRIRYGLDQPFIIQYWRWIKQILQGDFGYSLINQQSITAELATRLPNTIRLIVPAYVTALLLALGLGLVAGAYQGQFLDRFIESLTSVGIAIPTFWFGMLMIYFFGYKLDLFPILGMYTVGQPATISDYFAHFWMPYITLTVAFFPELTRYLRAATIQQVTQDYVTVQKAFQASPWQMFTRHISRNILIPVVTQIGLALPMLVTGAIITETIFDWPGVGPYLMAATRGLDYPVIMAIMLLSATLVILGNLLSDVLYFVVDPRIRNGGQQL